DLHKLVEEMIETMDAYDGVGLAAPQVHHSIRLFVTRKIPEPNEEEKGLGEVEVFINPEVLEAKSEVWKAPEGCLSIPTIHAEVERPE
ncbi:peptide deformylase, partial [Neobacillus thermocopriae]|uniref:peptide deformylase n=1 Tax=Neobacillus thermocopriae TaxID=1215031 RepID=UPI003770240C